MTREEAIKLVKRIKGAMVYTEEEKKALETLIPELRESDDERIRRKLFAILEWAKCYGDCGFTPDEVKEIITYLEKQKEQKPEIKVIIPKFRVGDIIKRVPFEKWDSTKRVESIDEHGYTFNFKHLNKSGGGYIGFAFEKEYELDEQKPAERNTATINGEPVPTENHSVNIPLAVWSEEDEEMIHDIIDLLDSNLAASDFHEIENWLKSLPERFNLQPKQEWSEEDEALFELLHQCVCRCINDDRMDYSERDKISKTMIPFIEKLQTLHPQQQTICDEKYVPSREMILAIWELGHVWKETNATGVTQREYIQKHWKESSYYDKLKSTNPQPHTVSIKDATKFGNLEYERGVKDGIQHEKNHQWKPSEDQMEALKNIFGNFEGYPMMKSLYNDLKKLM